MLSACAAALHWWATTPARSASDPVRRGGRPRKVFDPTEIKELRHQGVSFRKIARRLGLGEGTVRRALQTGSDGAAVRQNLKGGNRNIVLKPFTGGVDSRIQHTLPLLAAELAYP